MAEQSSGTKVAIAITPSRDSQLDRHWRQRPPGALRVAEMQRRGQQPAGNQRQRQRDRRAWWQAPPDRAGRARARRQVRSRGRTSVVKTMIEGAGCMWLRRDARHFKSAPARRRARRRSPSPRRCFRRAAVAGAVGQRLARARRQIFVDRPRSLLRHQVHAAALGDHDRDGRRRDRRDRRNGGHWPGRCARRTARGRPLRSVSL